VRESPPQLSPAESRLDPERALARLRRLAVGSVIVFSAFGLLGGIGTAAAVAAGGALALANYYLLLWAVQRLVAHGKNDVGPVKAALGLVLRYVLLGLILYVIFSVWRANALAVIVGFSAPVVAVIVEGAVQVYWTLSSSGNRASRDRS
jgi:hypothetical protein